MKPERLHLALVLASLLVLGVALTRERAKPNANPAPAQPSSNERLELGAIPKDAALVVSFDLARGSEPLRSLLFGKQAELPTLGSIAEVCDYDPSHAVRSMTLAAFRPDRATNREQSFGIVASGDFDQARLATCAMKLLQSRGGSPERQRAGSMTLVRDRAARGAEVALLDEGLVLVSTHDQLRNMLQVLDGSAPSVKGNPTHERVRRALGASAHGLATLELRPGWLEQLFESEDVKRSPLSELDAAGLRLDLGDPILLEALFSCRTPEACARFEEFLGALRQKLGPALERQGLGFLGRAALERRGSEVRAKWKLDVATLTRLGQSLGQPLAPQDAPKAPPFEPEESIPAKP